MKTKFLISLKRFKAILTISFVLDICTVINVKHVFPFHTAEARRGFTAVFEITVQFEVNFSSFFFFFFVAHKNPTFWLCFQFRENAVSAMCNCHFGSC